MVECFFSFAFSLIEIFKKAMETYSSGAPQ